MKNQYGATLCFWGSIDEQGEEAVVLDNASLRAVILRRGAPIPSPNRDRLAESISGFSRSGTVIRTGTGPRVAARIIVAQGGEPRD